MHSQIFRDFTEFLTVICDIISTPSPLYTNEVKYALCISFSLQKGNHNVTGNVSGYVVQRK